MQSSSDIVRYAVDNPLHRDTIQVRKWAWEMAGPDDPVCRTPEFIESVALETLSYFKQCRHLIGGNISYDQVLMRCTEEVYQSRRKEVIPLLVSRTRFRRMYERVIRKTGDQNAMFFLLRITDKMDPVRAKALMQNNFWQISENVTMTETGLDSNGMQELLREAYSEACYWMVQLMPRLFVRDMDGLIAAGLQTALGDVPEYWDDQPDKAAVEIKRNELMACVASASEEEIELLMPILMRAQQRRQPKSLRVVHPENGETPENK